VRPLLTLLHKEIHSPQRRKERREFSKEEAIIYLCVLCVSAVKAVFLGEH
jgi:hypothetical protein